MKYFIPLFSILFFFSIQGAAQVVKEGKPHTYKKKIVTEIPEHRLPSFDIQEYIEKIDKKPQRKKIQFAKMFDLDMNLLEVASTLKLDEGTLYLYSIRSENAYSVQVVFNEFKIPKGSELFIYNKDYSHIVGAITNENNKESGVLPVAPVQGDKVIIEYFEPENVEFAGSIKIGAAGHDFLNIYGKSGKEESGLGDAADCNVNINCPAGADWQDQKRAITRVVAGGYLCSGSLMNNTNYNNIPYFLTANHCIDSKEVAEGAIFYFNFESPECDTTYYDQSMQTLSGAKLISTSLDNKLDFTLVELTNNIPAHYEPFMAGWNIDTTNIQNTTSIHHPMGDVKKITKDYHPPVVDNFGDSYDKNTHWRVKQWDLGTTEGGSSGAPLFDQNKRIIGDLTGGAASCDYNYNDYFAMLYYSWDSFGEPEYQMKFWLDPQNTGFIALDGYKPYLERPSSLRAVYDENQITLNWNTIIESSNVSYYEVYRDNQKIDETTGTSYNDNPAVKDSVYFYKVRAYTSSGDYTAYSNRVGVVPVQSRDLPYNYSFENQSSFETGWYEHSFGNSEYWTIGTGGNNFTGASDGSFNAAFNANQDDVSRLVTPKLNMGSNDYVLLSFDLSIPAVQGQNDMLSLYFRYADSLPWKKLKVYNTEISGWQQQKVYLPATSEDYLVAFEGNGQNGDGVYIDNIQFYADPDVVQPSFSSNSDTICSLSSVTITLDTTDVYDSYQWDMGYGAQPRYISEYGPHEIMYTFRGEKTIQLKTNGKYKTTEKAFIKVNEIPVPYIQNNGDTLVSNYEEGNQWYRDGEIIRGATERNYIVEQMGTYKVEVTNQYGCTAFSNLIEITGLGITEERLAENFFKIYPNPSNQHIRIIFKDDWPGTKPSTYSIYDLKGTLIDRGDIRANDGFSIFTGSLNNGIYIFRIIDSTGAVYSKTFMKR